MNYENEILLNWYLLFHFGTAKEILSGTIFDEENFPEGSFQFPEKSVQCFERKKCARALDIGCAVGRSSFALTRIAEEVVGIDFSQQFIDTAESLRVGEKVEYLRYSEMNKSDCLQGALPSDCLPDAVSFHQGDAMNLGPNLGSFDLVHAANLLCRLSEPLRFLDRLPDLVKQGGELVIATPATWLEEYTPREKQPQRATLDFLKESLSREFELADVVELPFVIREHQRKLQLSSSQTSRWIRR